jgi:hypothetical protein
MGGNGEGERTGSLDATRLESRAILVGKVKPYQRMSSGGFESAIAGQRQGIGVPIGRRSFTGHVAIRVSAAVDTFGPMDQFAVSVRCDRATGEDGTHVDLYNFRGLQGKGE